MVNQSMGCYVVVSTTTKGCQMSSLNDVCAQRRSILAALPGVILLPGLVAACSSPATPPSADPPPSAVPTGSEAGSANPQVPQAQVPVGTATVVSGRPHPYVVAQPTVGHFVAFSAACTHRGVTVNAGDGMTLVCPAHGSQFNADTGAVLKGPAASPLTAVPVKAANGVLTLG